MGSLVITETAIEAVKRIVGKTKGIITVRLDLQIGSCSWPSFGLSFDNKSANDFVWHTGNIEWVITRALLAKACTIKIDYFQGIQGERFSITSDYPLATTCLGCSTKCRNNLKLARGSLDALKSDG
ncbi:Fe-S cluster assembly iron-binding protein IscA [Syntrophus gentianae]|uniref:Fe-S cluster assembly iron-binding protein IscA n=1 Tax=Syntrophus gentianae TaxID=43775 RepID=A0A1H7UZL1_9BACT|nr:hypothetical protein [Syntrophus gentianae]SEM02402.1 Fe-S cluster assembly iron-binding protein IscA [Syntrophus gentianae]